MKYLVLLGMVLLISSCGSLHSRSMLVKWGPVNPSKKGTEIRVKMQDNCPVSVTDLHDASTVAACQSGTVIKSAAACREAGDTVTWKVQGNGTFDIQFASDTVPLTSHVTCTGTGGNFHCNGTVSSTAILHTEYQYLVTSGTCPALDPYLIRY